MEAVEYRFFALEYRAEAGNKVTGTVLRYGSVAEIGGAFQERFAPGAFGDVQSSDVIANVQHDRRKPVARTQGGGLRLSDSATELKADLELADTTDGKDALELLRRGILKGFSVEFTATKESYQDEVRVVEKADLSAISLVDRPAYGDSHAAVSKRFALMRSAKAYAAKPAAETLWL